MLIGQWVIATMSPCSPERTQVSDMREGDEAREPSEYCF